MEDLEAKKLRDSLVEYESHLSEMRQVTLKNVETLDVIGRYTDKSAAGIQKLTEQGLEGIQKVTAESAGGLRRIIETGNSNISRLAESAEDSLNRTSKSSEETLKDAAESGEACIRSVAENGEAGIRRVAQSSVESLKRVTDCSEESITNIAQECLNKLQSFTEAGMKQIVEAAEKSLESAEAVEKIEKALLEHMDAMKELMKQSDDFTHKENVKVYRNVQAVVIDETKKQTETLMEQKEELEADNERLFKQNRVLTPLVIVTLVATIANIALLIAQILGVF